MTTTTQLQPPKPQVARRASKDPAHLPLHRRLLFPYHGLDSALPKLVKGDGEDIDRINERSASMALRTCDKLIYRIHHLIALALRAYVLSWYTRISPRDRALLPSINNTIITPLLQPILTSIYDDSAPLLDLVLLDLPTIITLHIKTYREAVHNTALGYGPLGDAYHARLPLASVVKVGERWELSPLYYTSLADGLLKNGLSVEEYGSTVERLMARELVGRMVLGGVGKRLSEDWFWYSLLLKLLGEAGETAQNVKEHSAAKSKPVVETAHRWITRIWSVMMTIWTGIFTLFAFYSATPPAEPRYDGCIRPWLSLFQTLIGYDEARDGKRILARLLVGTTDGIALLASPLVDRYVLHQSPVECVADK
jgi:hypothetical protein